jgi:hypothetical protein
MKPIIFVIFSILCFYVGFHSNDNGIKSGNIIFTNLRSQNSEVVSDVILVGERSPFKRELTIEFKDFPLYDKEGNRLFRILNYERHKK